MFPGLWWRRVVVGCPTRAGARSRERQLGVQSWVCRAVRLWDLNTRTLFAQESAHKGLAKDWLVHAGAHGHQRALWHRQAGWQAMLPPSLLAVPRWVHVHLASVHGICSHLQGSATGQRQPPLGGAAT